MTTENEVIEPVIVPEPEVAAEPEVVPEPVVAPIPEPAPLPEQRYEYQPTDAAGNALGGKQVIKYRTTDELAEKLRDQNIELVRKLREVSRKQRLGIIEDEEAPADADRLPSFEFKKKELTAEERFEISQDLNDPAKFDQASSRLFESQVGAKPEEFVQVMNQQQLATNQLLARQNAGIFFESHPDFHVCEYNVSYLCDWMTKRGLSPTVRNFEYAYGKIKQDEAGLLQNAPSREEPPAPVRTVVEEKVEAKPQPPTEPITRISETEQSPEQRGVPSGLNSRSASNSGVPAPTTTLTLKQINDMSSEEYRKQLLTNPEFGKLVNDLHSQAHSR